jgi:hypothetical protein
MIIKVMPYSKDYLQSEEGKKWKSIVDKKYREKNQDKIKKYADKYREEHKETNKEINKERCKIYRDKNKDILNEKQREYRARKRMEMEDFRAHFF